MAEEFKGLRVKSYSEVYRLVNERLRSLRLGPEAKRLPREERLRRILVVKASAAFSIVSEELSALEKALLAVETSHPFYREMFRQFSGVLPSEALERVRALKKALARLDREYRRYLGSAAPGEELVAKFKEALGRALSVYRRLDKMARAVKGGLTELSKMPSVKGDLVVVIAGMPQVGKSTLLSRLTRARPEIGHFPFTTKTIVVGHIEDQLGKVVLVDTPGILDRPLEEMNDIERKAVLAMRHLAEALIYIFDASPSAYYTLEQQLRTYKTAEGVAGGRPVLVVMNKIDLLSKQQLEEALEAVRVATGRDPLPISAAMGTNLDKLDKALRDMLREKMSSRELR